MKHIEVDLAVVAAGPAGLAAAITGAEQGLEVVVFEKGATPGGTANMGMGPFAVESHIQRENMIGITREQAFDKMMDYTHWNVDPKIVHDYFWKSADTIAWLEDMGVKFAGALPYYPEGVATWHVVQPEDGSRPGPRAASTMIKRMFERAQELGIQFYFETPVQKLIREEDHIMGFIARGTDGEEYEVDAIAVVVATGGFGCNDDMLKEHLGYTWGEDLFSFRIPGIEGDGLRMAWEIGAAKGPMELERMLNFESPNMAQQFPCALGFAQPRALAVNRRGERICNEYILQNRAVASNIADRQPGRCIYLILSDEVVKQYRRSGVDWVNGVFHGNPMERFEEQVAQAMVEYPNSFFSADSLAELAAAIGMDPDTLEATAAAYNASCGIGYDELYCKPHRYLTPIRGSRFYAMRQVIGGYSTLGGIKIDSRFRVLDEGGKAIEGLYAASSDVCNLYNGTYLYYFAGNSMGFALNSGRLAAEHAAEYLNEEEDADS